MVPCKFFDLSEEMNVFFEDKDPKLPYIEAQFSFTCLSGYLSQETLKTSFTLFSYKSVLDTTI